MPKQANAAQATVRRFSLLDSVSYAAGDFGCNMSFALKSTLIIFWTQFMGMDSALYALLLVVVQIWDAVNDPLIGSLIDADHHRHRRNKFLAYISIGSIGLIVGGALCFLPLPRAPLWAKIAVFIGGYVIWDAFYTVANVPYGSLLSLISSVDTDRASLSAWRAVGSTLGNMVPIAVLPFLIYDKEENLIGERVFLAALIMGGIGFLCFRFMIRNTVIRVETDVRLHEERPRFHIGRAFLNFVKNRPAVGATVAAMGMFLGINGAASAVTVLFQSYFKNVEISGLVQVFGMLPVVLFTPIARRMVSKYGKKELAVFGSLCSIAASLLLLLLPITPDAQGIALYVVCQLINSLGMGIYATVSWAMMGDAVDYNEWKSGAREEGVVYSLHSFFRKLAQGIGPSLILIIMYRLGYVGANKGNQSLSVATNMRYLVAALYLFSAVLQFVGLALIYDLNRHKLREMNEALAKKRAAGN
ncbi:MAG: MFS transporter [Clostridia bacterium]|nr:MFS transporter [Clostridia bacterium]